MPTISCTTSGARPSAQHSTSSNIKNIRDPPARRSKRQHNTNTPHFQLHFLQDSLTTRCQPKPPLETASLLRSPTNAFILNYTDDVVAHPVRNVQFIYTLVNPLDRVCVCWGGKGSWWMRMFVLRKGTHSCQFLAPNARLIAAAECVCAFCMSARAFIARRMPTNSPRLPTSHAVSKWRVNASINHLVVCVCM